MPVSEERIKQWNDQVEAIIQANEAGVLSLNDWEEGFIDSIHTMLAREKILSFKQSSILREIFDRIE